jgi:hypothetical protein
MFKTSGAVSAASPGLTLFRHCFWTGCETLSGRKAAHWQGASRIVLYDSVRKSISLNEVRLKSFILTLMFFLSFGAINLLAHSSSSHSHHTKDKPRKEKKEKKETAPKNTSGSVHVRGYQRKDGTYVSPYDRSAPTSSGSSITSPSAVSAQTRSNMATLRVGDSQPYKTGHLATGYTLDSTVHRGMFGRITRSGAAKDSFKRLQPCPSNGNTHGACPGYVIDHVRPLECGGADTPSNMQWQTVADGKAKDKTEHSCRQ